MLHWGPAQKPQSSGKDWQEEGGWEEADINFWLFPGTAPGIERVPELPHIVPEVPLGGENWILSNHSSISSVNEAWSSNQK